MAITRLSPFISAIEARHAGQRLRWSSIRMRRLPPSVPLRYARKSGRNSAQLAPAALVTLSQTRARAASSVPASTSSSLISCSARSSRSSDIADLLLDSVRLRFRLRSCSLSATALLALHFGLQPEPDPVEPDGHVVLLELEHPGQLFDSTAPRRDAAGTGLRPRCPGWRWRAEAAPSAATGAATAACGARSSYTDSA